MQLWLKNTEFIWSVLWFGCCSHLQHFHLWYGFHIVNFMMTIDDCFGLYSLVTFTRCIHSLLMIIHDIQDQINNNKWFIDTIDPSEFKDWRYEIFLKHTFISSWLQIVLMIVNAALSFYAETPGASNLLLNLIWIMVNIGFISLLYRVLYKIIDYEMDFNIFTVDQFMLFRQHWFFKTESMNIATSTIKIVKESKSWFLWSLFNYWKVSVHPEWNLSNTSKAIELFYVPNPKMLTKKLNDFIEKSKEGMNISLMS